MSASDDDPDNRPDNRPGNRPEKPLTREQGHRRVAEAISDGLAVRAERQRAMIKAAAARARRANTIHADDAPGVRASKAAILALADAFEHFALAGADGQTALLGMAYELGGLFGGVVASRCEPAAADARLIEDLAATFGKGAITTAHKEKHA